MDEKLQRYRRDFEGQPPERTAVLAGINRIFREALVCVTKGQLGLVCLVVAKELTGSKFGFIGELDQAGKFSTIAISNSGEAAPELPKSETLYLLKYLKKSNLRRRILNSGETYICNDLASHPDWIKPHKIHPSITSFMGVPLKLAGHIYGMVGLANREGGYDRQNQEDMEALAVTVVEALMRKKAERKLVQLRRHHELILSSASEGIMGVDRKGHITFVNPAAVQMLGFEEEELIGQYSHTLCHHQKANGSPYPAEECPILETLRRGILLSFQDDFFWRKDGTGFPVRYSSNPIIQNNQILGAVVTFRDITARKEAETALQESEKKYRTLVETTDTGYLIMDSQGRVTDANPEYVRLSGHKSLEEILGRSVLEWTAEYDRERNAGEVIKCLQQGYVRGLEIDYVDGKGRITPIEINATVIKTGQTLQVVSLCRDITARKQVEDALRKSEQRFRDITEHAVEWIWEVDHAGKYTYSSLVAEKLLGYTPEEVLGKHFYDFFLPEEREELKDAALATFKAKQPFKDFINRNLRKNGETIWLSTSGVPVLDASGGLLGYRGADHDITAHKQAEAEITRLASFAQLTPNPVLEVDNQGKITFANPAANALVQRFDLPDLQALLPADLEKILSSAREGGERQFRCEKRINNGVFAIYVYFVPQFQVAHLFFLDITERKRAEEATRQSEEMFRRTFDQSPIGAAIVGLDFRYQRANAELCRITGYSEKELASRTFMDITHPDDVAQSVEQAERLAAGEIDHFAMEKRYLRKDGKVVWVRLSVRLIKDGAGRPLCYLPMIEDITARKQVEAQLEQSLRRSHQIIKEIVRAMALTVEVRDPYTSGHQRRVTRLAQAIAREMGLSREQKKAIWVAGTLHDLGKVCVPAGILSRPGHLSDVEIALVQTHSEKGYEILKPIKFPWPVAKIVRQHHERLDGSGYPNGLRQEEILLEARILAVADVVEAMASHRPYRPARGIDEALEEISRNRGTLFDPEVVDACIKVFKRKGFKFD